MPANARARSLAEEKRGVRNNNPGNIKASNIPWEGISGVDEDGFLKFESNEYGWRALERNTITRAQSNPNETFTSYINRYASTSTYEERVNYANFVANELGTQANSPIANYNPADIASAMGFFESGVRMDNNMRQRVTALLRGF